MKSFHVCRICLVQEVNLTTMQPLFDKDNSKCSEIVKQIEECGGITIKPCDELPKYICLECLGYLDVSYKFRTLCQASDNALLNKIVIKAERGLDVPDQDLLQPKTSLNHNDIFLSNGEINETTDVSVSVRELVKEEFQPLCDQDELNDSNGSEYQPDDCKEEPFDEFQNKYKKRKTRNLNSSKYLSNKMKTSKIIKRQKGSLKNFKIPKSELITRNRKNKSDTPMKIMCELCGNMYTKQSILNLHMRRHLDVKPYICELCSKAFACQAEMNRHMRVHTGDKPFACKFCGRTFGDRSTNLKHERIHTNERPFSCKTCGKAFSYSNVLKNHMLTHTGEKPFRCIPCDKTFSRKHQLAQHLATRTHHQTVNASSSIEDVK